jgi:hypothetical protein
MNRKSAWILGFSLILAAVAHGQVPSNAAPVVMGHGTPNYLPLGQVTTGLETPWYSSQATTSAWVLRVQEKIQL